nr:coiled-coil domain-containing protein 102A-like isoform X12 [Dermacentor andersoni]
MSKPVGIKAESSSQVSDEPLCEEPPDIDCVAHRREPDAHEVWSLSEEAPAAQAASKVKMELLCDKNDANVHRMSLLADEHCQLLAQREALEDECRQKKEEHRRLVEYLRRLAGQLCNKYDFSNMTATELTNGISIMVDHLSHEYELLSRKYQSLWKERESWDQTKVDALSAERDAIMADNEGLRRKLKDYDDLQDECRVLSEGVENFVALTAEKDRELAIAQEQITSLNRESLATAGSSAEDCRREAAVIHEKDSVIMDLREKLKAAEEKLAGLQHVSGRLQPCTMAVAVAEAPSGAVRDLGHPVTSLATSQEEQLQQNTNMSSRTQMERTLGLVNPPEATAAEANEEAEDAYSTMDEDEELPSSDHGTVPTSNRRSKTKRGRPRKAAKRTYNTKRGRAGKAVKRTYNTRSRTAKLRSERSSEQVRGLTCGRTLLRARVEALDGEGGGSDRTSSLSVAAAATWSYRS